MSTVRMEGGETSPQSVQPTISHNVRILMAYKGVNQKGIGEVVGKSATSVGHKLAGRADWSADEIAALSVFGGPQWPLARFFNDPEASSPSLAKVSSYLSAVPGEGRKSRPKPVSYQPPLTAAVVSN